MWLEKHSDKYLQDLSANPCAYSFIDKSTNAVCYIGSTNSFELRLAQHLNVSRYETKSKRFLENWNETVAIHVYPCVTMADAVALEAELINLFDPPWNKRKKTNNPKKPEILDNLQIYTVYYLKDIDTWTALKFTLDAKPYSHFTHSNLCDKPKLDSDYTVYRFIDRWHNVAYIGSTTNLNQRLRQHFNYKNYDFAEYYVLLIDCIKCKTYADMLWLELALITKYKPYWNTYYKSETVPKDLSQVSLRWCTVPHYGWLASSTDKQLDFCRNELRDSITIKKYLPTPHECEQFEFKLNKISPEILNQNHALSDCPGILTLAELNADNPDVLSKINSCIHKRVNRRRKGQIASAEIKSRPGYKPYNRHETIEEYMPL